MCTDRKDKALLIAVSWRRSWRAGSVVIDRLFLPQWDEPSQTRLDLYKVRFSGKLLLRERRRGKRKRESPCVEREKNRRDQNVWFSIGRIYVSEGQTAQPLGWKVQSRVWQIGTEGCWENLEARSTLICIICFPVIYPWFQTKQEFCSSREANPTAHTVALVSVNN